MASSEVDISQLTEEQQAALQQYTSVTDQDLSAAVALLQRCQWNVPIAISRFFDGEPLEPVEVPPEDIPPPPPQTSRRHDTLANSFSQPHGSSSTRRQTYSQAPRVVATPSNHLNQQLPPYLALLLTPVNLAYALFTRLFGFLFRLLPFIPRAFSRIAARAPNARSLIRAGHRRPLGPQDTTARFLREFEEEYGEHSLPFLDMSYARAFDLAKRDLKFLLVVPLSPEHDFTSDFVRNTLLSPLVTSFLQNPSNNMLLWSGSMWDSETLQVANSLNFTTFPCCAMIVHTPSISSTSMSVVLRMEGEASRTCNHIGAIITPEQFVASMQAAISQHSPTLNQARAQRAEQQSSRDLRDQQNSAYERSLAQDRERARQKREAEATRLRQEQEEAEQQAKEEKTALERRNNEETHARNLDRWRRWRAKSLQPEPETADKGAARVSVRLSSGERVVRRFNGEAGIEELYAFVECYSYLKEENGAAEDEKDVERPEDFKHEYGFRLVSPMPREVYALEDGGTVREKIGRSGNLIVERIEGDEPA